MSYFAEISGFATLGPLEYKAVELLEPPRSEPNEEAVRNRLKQKVVIR